MLPKEIEKIIWKICVLVFISTIIGTLIVGTYAYLTIDCNDIGNSTMHTRHYISGFINDVEYDHTGNVTIHFTRNSSMSYLCDGRINTTMLKFVNCTIPIKENVTATLFFDTPYVYSPMGYVPDVYKPHILVDVTYV